MPKVKSQLGDQSQKAVYQDFDRMGAAGILKLECITVLSGHENEVKCGAWGCLCRIRFMYKMLRPSMIIQFCQFASVCISSCPHSLVVHISLRLHHKILHLH